MQDEDGDASGLARKFRELRGNFTQEAMARKLGVDRSRISKIENGALPTVPECDAYDTFRNTGGELVAWRQRVVSKGEQTTMEVSPTDRRQAVTGLAAAGLVALDISRATSAATADELSVHELQADVYELAASYTTTPHAKLAPIVLDRWQQVRSRLPNTLGVTRDDLVLLFAQFSYYLGRLAFNTGDLRTARRFGDVAIQYARASGEIVITGSAAALLSSIDYYEGDYKSATRRAAWARENADHPYLAPRLAMYEARSRARLRDTDAAVAAIKVIEMGTTDVEPRPGESPFPLEVAEHCVGECWALLGDSRRAESAARAAVAHFERSLPSGFESHGLALVALAEALLRREKPEVKEAAIAAQRTVTLLAAHPTWTVEHDLWETFAILVTDHATQPAVRDLREQIKSHPSLTPPAQLL